MKAVWLFIFISCLATGLGAQTRARSSQADSIKAYADSLKARIDPIKTYTTASLNGVAPKIDGLPDDAAWQYVEWGGGDFRQLQPDAGAAPTVQTKFKILYDAKNLYI